MTRTHISRWISATAVLLTIATCCDARIVVLQNGMEVQGLVANIGSMGNNLFAGVAGGGGVKNQLIFVVDDGLRRVYFSKYQLDRQRTRDEIETLESIAIGQPVQRQGNVIGTIGPLAKVPTPFNEFGQRTLTLRSPNGAFDVVQGITEVTPRYIRIEALHSRPSVQWDMRVATSSIPRETLKDILKQQVDQEDSEERLKVVRLYLQSRRYEDARLELESVISDFPDLQDLKGQLDEISKLNTKQRLTELKLRQSAGQHQLVWNMLDQFDPEKTADEQLVQIRDMHDAYSKQVDRIQAVHSRVAGFVGELEAGPLKSMMTEFQSEILAELSVNTIERMADFERLADDADLTNEQKLALAVSGWLTGNAADNLTLASSLWRTRAVIRQYLASDDINQRAGFQAAMSSEEANSPKHIADLLAAMKPPLPMEDDQEQVQSNVELESDSAEEPEADSSDQASGDATEESNRTIELSVEGPFEEQIRYLVHLPPEYDPYRYYPTIVALHPAGGRPDKQLDWWAGPKDPVSGERIGQATRHGYITIAPAWTKEGQRSYHYSAAEHAAVLFTLRDAFQRFSIDTDRVFLTGHSMGADAAWDIGLAHPDLWAGVIPIGGQAYHKKQIQQYVSLYWKNAKHVPFYFVGGAKDGERQKKNSRDFNRYFTNAGFDVMVVEYLGRGNENYYDEIQNLFQWMGLHRREPNRDQFKVVTLRPWDNFFWWAEVDEIPSRSIILPAAWPQKSPRPSEIEGNVYKRNLVKLTTGAAKAKIYLTPDLVDFEQKITINVNGRNKPTQIDPDVNVILEDARRRGDRIRPFWASFETTTGRKSR